MLSCNLLLIHDLRVVNTEELKTSIYFCKETSSRNSFKLLQKNMFIKKVNPIRNQVEYNVTLKYL